MINLSKLILLYCVSSFAVQLNVPQYDRLVRDLGNADYRIRERANGTFQQLLEIDSSHYKARSILRQAMESRDRETQYRAERLLRNMRIRSPAESVILRLEDDTISGIALSPDNRLLAVATYGGDFYLYDQQRSERLYSEHFNGQVWAVGFSPRNRLVAFAVRGSGLFVCAYSADGRRVEPILRDPYYGISNLDFTKDGRAIAYSGDNHNITIRELSSGRELTSIPQTRNSSLATFPQSRTLATIQQSRLTFFDFIGNRHINSLDAGYLYSFAISSDERIIATGGPQKKISFWETPTLRKLGEIDYGKGLAINEREPWKMTFSPNGHWLAVNESGNAVSIWEVASGRRLRTFETLGRNNSGVGITFDSEGSTLFFVGQGGSVYRVRLFEMIENEQLPRGGNNLDTLWRMLRDGSPEETYWATERFKYNGARAITYLAEHLAEYFTLRTENWRSLFNRTPNEQRVIRAIAALEQMTKTEGEGRNLLRRLSIMAGNELLVSDEARRALTRISLHQNWSQ